VLLSVEISGSRCLALRQEPLVASRRRVKVRCFVNIRRSLDNVRQRQAVPQVSHIASHRVVDLVAVLVGLNDLVNQRDRVVRRADVMRDLLG
jgi:hypothetical protein